MPNLVIVSAGISQPSTTRMLADRVAQATLEQLQGPDDGVTLRCITRPYVRQVGGSRRPGNCLGGCSAKRFGWPGIAVSYRGVVLVRLARVARVSCTVPSTSAAPSMIVNIAKGKVPDRSSPSGVNH